MTDLKKYKIVSMRPDVNTPVTLVSAVMEEQRYFIHQIYCANTIDANRIFKLYYGKEGSTDNHNILVPEVSLAAYESLVLDMGVYLNIGEAIAVETIAADSICFTVFGQLETVKGGGFKS